MYFTHAYSWIIDDLDGLLAQVTFKFLPFLAALCCESMSQVFGWLWITSRCQCRTGWHSRSSLEGVTGDVEVILFVHCLLHITSISIIMKYIEIWYIMILVNIYTYIYICYFFTFYPLNISRISVTDFKCFQFSTIFPQMTEIGGNWSPASAVQGRATAESESGARHNRSSKSGPPPSKRALPGDQEELDHVSWS